MQPEVGGLFPTPRPERLAGKRPCGRKSQDAPIERSSQDEAGVVSDGGTFAVGAAEFAESDDLDSYHRDHRYRGEECDQCEWNGCLDREGG
jgi:hypothetical protein